MSTPLKNKRVALTRPDNESLAKKLKALGAEIIDMPLTEIAFDSSDNIDILSEIGHYSVICFTSANGVEGFFKHFFKKYTDIRCIGAAALACVGKATSEALAKFYLETDIMPTVHNGESLAQAIMEHRDIENEKILVVCGSLSKEELPKILQEKGNAIVDTYQVYSTIKKESQTLEDAMFSFVNEGADAIIFMSPSAVEVFADNMEKFVLSKKARKPKTLSIGSTTSSAMRKLGIPLSAEAKEATEDSLVDAIINLI